MAALSLSSSLSSSASVLRTASESSSAALSTSAWRYEAWLSAFPLNRATVLDYFKHSPFYDPACNNERTAAAAGGGGGGGGAAQQLRGMEGVEFEVDQSVSASPSPDPSYFLVRKQWRSSPSRVHALALYYVVGVDAAPLLRGSVVFLPALAEVARCAVDGALTQLNAAVHALISASRDAAHDRGDADADAGDDGAEREVAESAALPSPVQPSPARVPRLQLADDALRRLLTGPR